MHQRESGTGDLFFLSRSKGCGNSLYERRLAGSQITAQQNNFWRSKEFAERAPQRDGFFRRMGGEFPPDHLDDDVSISGSALHDPWRPLWLPPFRTTKDTKYH